MQRYSTSFIIRLCNLNLAKIGKNEIKTTLPCISEAFFYIIDSCESGTSTEDNLNTHTLYIYIYFYKIFYRYMFKIHIVFDLVILFLYRFFQVNVHKVIYENSLKQ